MTPITSTPVRSLGSSAATRPIITTVPCGPHSDPAESPSLLVALLVGGSTCYCAPSASWRRINGSRLDQTTNGRCAIGNWSESIHRSKWLWRPSPSGFSTRKRYHTGGTTGAHEPREPTATGTYSRRSERGGLCSTLSISLSLGLSFSLSRGNSSTRGNDDWYALYPPRSIVNALMKGSQIFTGLRAKEGWRKKLLFRKFLG